MSGQGVRSVGYACCYVPVEIIMAAGFTASRIVPEGRCLDVHGRIHPNTCCYVKSMLADALAGAYAGMDAVVLANSCDAMRKLYDLWNAYVKRPLALFLDIPKKRDPGAEAFFLSGCKRLATDLGGFPHGRSVTGERLVNAIRHMNDLRSAWMDLFKALHDQDHGVRGEEVLALLQGASRLDVAGQTAGIRKALHGRDGSVRAQSGMRVLMAGNILNSPVPLSLIEGAGGRIVGFDTCFGRRHWGTPVEEHGDPWGALARRYLQRPPCARMMGMGDQVGELKKAIGETGAEGVVLTSVRYCDNLAYGIPLLKGAIEAAGARCQVMENDYEWNDPERVRTRIEAFLQTH
jgi:benzoyl-CoA reductase/2-hydroxyglutaryl-CoA dehydratase subunit BcrC/BadD/HgdB